ncbi:MAG: hypothetical protein H0W25_05535, partial [Acidimicrobiia bacterium]|nr:hypothetical protein [Acidimicrobiia bacterium]
MSTAVDDLLAHAGPRLPERDRYGRYMIPDPHTGRKRAWTRATTVASTLSDKFGLQQWAQRMTAIGLTRRADLYARVAATPIDDKQAMNRLVDEAKEAAAASAGANVGTALHSFTERLDRGEDVLAPAPWDADLEVYRTTMAGAGVVVVPRMIEVIVTLPELGVAGTFDRVVTVPGGELPLVADLKSGGFLDWCEISIQLALYAHAETIYDLATGQHLPIPALDQERALVMHLPAGKATCTLWQVDIAAGWEAVQQAMWVRTWRKRKGIATALATMPTGPVPGDDGLGDRLVDWLRDRVAQVVMHLDGRALPVAWPEGVPTFRNGGPTTAAHLAELERWCNVIEAQLGLQFPALKPSDAVAEPASSNGVHHGPPPKGDTPAEIHASLKARFLAVQANDLRDAATAQAREAGVADVGRLTEAQVAKLTSIIEALEASWELRKAFLASLVQGMAEDEVQAVVDVVAPPEPDESGGSTQHWPLDALHVDHIESIEALLALIDAGGAAFSYDGASATLVAVEDVALELLCGA